MIGAGCLEDDAFWLQWGDPGDEPGNTLAIIVELFDDRVGMQMSIQSVFRDVDSKGDLIRRWCYDVIDLFLSHACHPGRETPRYPFGPEGKEGDDPTLTRSYLTAMISIPSPSPSAGCNLPMVNHSAVGDGQIISKQIHQADLPCDCLSVKGRAKGSLIEASICHPVPGRRGKRCGKASRPADLLRHRA